MVSPVTPVVALALGACAPPLYVNVVVPHITATGFELIVVLTGVDEVFDAAL